MCLRDLLTALRGEGVAVTESQVRWAITSAKIDRPPLDGSLRFDFGQDHLEQLRRLFGAADGEVRKC
jgi:hypothetical protein